MGTGYGGWGGGGGGVGGGVEGGNGGGRGRGGHELDTQLVKGAILGGVG